MAETTDSYPINFNVLAEDFREQQAGTKGWSQEDAEWLFESLNKMCNAYDEAVQTEAEFVQANSTETSGFTPDVLWTPFIKDGRAGFRCMKLGPKNDDTFIYMNPSTDGDEGAPDVFVYMGPNNDPALDGTLHFYTPEFEGDKS